uniref:Si:dkey-57k2.6 n=1 Tax=Astyanax mexicanus TaxID=7994 RepID=A0A3B1JGS1_ASTMX
MSSRRSSCNWAVALLVLWSMVSLVVVVVWASWPAWAGLEGCQREIQALEEKLEGARVMKAKDLQAVERELKQSRENQSRLQLQIEHILQDIQLTNLSLTDALLEKAMLQENLTALESEVSESVSVQARLSQERALNEAEIFALQVNLTSEEHQLDSCMALRDASHSQQVAADSKRKACESKSKYFHKHLESCAVQE